jgi:membrane protease YdiL (CAAX protease family)
VALGLGTGTVAAVYLGVRSRGFDYIDLRRPGANDAAYVIVGVVALVGLNVGIGLAFQRLGVESAQHAIIRQAESDPGILLVLVPLSYLIIGPGEELLYRNVVQKSLYETYSRRGAVVVASAIFAAVHLFAFADPDGSALATVNTLAVVFVLSLVLGVVYERTENLVVPALVHGSFDAIAFAATYVRIAGL